MPSATVAHSPVAAQIAVGKTYLFATGSKLRQQACALHGFYGGVAHIAVLRVTFLLKKPHHQQVHDATTVLNIARRYSNLEISPPDGHATALGPSSPCTSSMHQFHPPPATVH